MINFTQILSILITIVLTGADAIHGLKKLEKDIGELALKAHKRGFMSPRIFNSALKQGNSVFL